jgi:hypothetical protein
MIVRLAKEPRKSRQEKGNWCVMRMRKISDAASGRELRDRNESVAVTRVVTAAEGGE